MTKLDFPDTPVVGQVYGSSGTTWRWDGARWASTAGPKGARGIVAMGTMLGTSVAMAGNTSIPVSNTINFTPVAGRLYRIRGCVRAILPPVGGTSGYLKIVSNNAAIYVNDTWNFTYSAYGNDTTELPFVGNGVPSTFRLDYYTSAAATVYADQQTSYFYIEDVTYEAGSSGGVPTPKKDEFQATFTGVTDPTVLSTIVNWSAASGPKPWPIVISATANREAAAGSVWQAHVGPAYISGLYWVVPLYISWLSNAAISPPITVWIRSVTFFGPPDS